MYTLLKFMKKISEICDKTFALKSAMEKHVASVHEKKKPFKCDICEYSCSSIAYLTVHVCNILYQFMRERNISNVLAVTMFVLSRVK